ncbi:peptidoglycan-binding domain-containing protein [Streptomyces griseoaurantiacus]|uniref:peptidoglycan-binding domain-containing protein n=1 Tax=Streptomyces griseoaurantiacus TaxID=68213 RepID=UPI002ED32EB3|nr:peptidoglycan-binding protein [Streptomyces jietaisiensis]
MPTPTDPPDRPGQPARRPVLEPTYVMRRRRTEALAELVREHRESREDRGAGAGTEAEPDYEAVLPGGPGPGAVPVTDLATEEMAPVTEPLASSGTAPPAPPYAGAGPGTGRRPRRRGHPARGVRGRAAGAGVTRRRAALAVGVAAAALLGFAVALTVTGLDGPEARRAAAPPGPAAAGAASRPAGAPDTDPDGAGTLREGDSGPAVSELQQRLLRVPDVYRDGATDGHYDAVLRAAVARFQLWYGIRGDESGVYGDDTRRDLESRTVR